MKKVDNRGGARPGAGRPRRDPNSDARKRFSFRLHPDTCDRIIELSDKLGIGRADVVDRAIAAFKD
jgi:hypothetical protein